MPVTSLHQPSQRWLTNFGKDAAPGYELTWSVGHPLGLTGEFTTIRLGPVVAHDERGEPLFDDADAHVKCSVWGEPEEWFPMAEIREAILAWKRGPYSPAFRLGAHEYGYSGFGGVSRQRSRQAVEA